jgi:HlyD family secretion protein
LSSSSATPLAGKVRMVAPTVDVQTRNALVYVDLNAPAGTLEAGRPGAFERGRIELGRTEALTLPQSAVLLRDARSYIFVVGADQKVSELMVQTGRRLGERIEIIKGLDATAQVVASGGSFLTDGDKVQVASGVPAKKSPVVTGKS